MRKDNKGKPKKKLRKERKEKRREDKSRDEILDDDNDYDDRNEEKVIQKLESCVIYYFSRCASSISTIPMELPSKSPKYQKWHNFFYCHKTY